MVVLLYARVFFLLSRCFVVFVVVRSSHVFSNRGPRVFLLLRRIRTTKGKRSGLKSLHFLHVESGEKKKKKKKKGSRLFGALFYYYHYHYYYYKGGKNRSRVGSCLRFCPRESGVVVVVVVVELFFREKEEFVSLVRCSFRFLLCSSVFFSASRKTKRRS